MKQLLALTWLIAILLGAGEVARWWGQPRFVPLAFDELLVAAALIAAATTAKRNAGLWLAPAWGLYCGMMLSLLVPTLDHLIFGPPKPSAAFYAAILAAMLAIGLAALLRAVSLIRAPSPSR